MIFINNIGVHFNVGYKLDALVWRAKLGSTKRKKGW
jgi:hypothetical protein